MVFLNHAGKELLREEIVRNGVDIEGEVNVELGGVEDGLAARAARIVDQNRRVAIHGADGGGG